MKRATARIAWRQARRAPWRSALAVAMVAIPIAALVFGSTVISTATTSSEERATATFGAAAIMVGVVDERFDVRALRSVLPQGSSVVVVRQTSGVGIAGGDDAIVAAITEVAAIDEPVLEGMFVLTSGRPAREPGEAVVHPAVLEVRGASIGDRTSIGDVEITIVGTAVRPTSVSDPFVVVQPGTIAPGTKSYRQALISLPPAADVREAVRAIRTSSGAREVTRRSSFTSADVSDAMQKAIATALSFAITALALGATGLIAAAAFAVGARRHLRVLGLVAAVGGERRDVRAVVLLNGSVLGAIGAIIGCALGLAGAVAALPHLAHYTDALPGPLEVNWPALIGAPLLGIAAATVAAWLPARTASRVAPMEALAGRLPPPRPPGKLAWVGLGIFALGFVITPISWRATYDSAGLTLGLGALGGGLLLAIPLAVTLVGRLAGRLPATLRLAARDVARQGRRTGAALAATTLALSAAVLASTAARADAEYWRVRSSLTAEQALIAGFEDANAAPDRLVAALREGMAGATVAGIAPVVRPDASPESSGVWATGPSRPIDSPEGFSSVESGSLAIGTPDLLVALDLPQAAQALTANEVVGLGIGSTERGGVTVRPDGSKPFRARASEVAVEGSVETNLPRYLISERGARALGLRPGSIQQVIVNAHRPITDGDVDLIERTAAGLGSYPFVMTVRSWQPATIGLRPIALGVGALVSLLIVGAALAMVGAEARRDTAILAAVGAAPAARRRLAAARAFLLTVVAGIIAVPAGIAPFAVLQWSRPDGYPVLAPWDGIAGAVIVIPALAALAGFVLSRRPSTDAMLRPLT